MDDDAHAGGGRPGRSGSAAIVFALASVLGAFVVVWSVYDARLRARELETLMQASGSALVESLGHAVEDALRASLEIEELAANRLLDQARLCERLDRLGALSAPELDRLAESLGLEALMVLDDDGRPRRASAHAVERTSWPVAGYVESLGALRDGRADYVLFGPRSLGADDATRFAVAVRRAGGGSILATMDTGEMLAFQEDIGPDHLIRTVSTTGGILDAWLEDLDGRVVGGVPPSRPLDPERLEFGRRVVLGTGRPGVLRLGLSGEVLAAARRAGTRRTMILGLAMFVLALALSTATVARQRARALRGEAARIRATADAVLDGMADAVVLLDDRSVIRLVNPVASRLFGKPADELVGRPCGQTWCANLLRTVDRPGAAQEVLLQPDDAEAFPALVSVSRVEVPTMGPVGTAIVLRDLRELRALEAQSRRTESLSALGTLAATVAHEVRNPLNSISVGVQRLEGDLAPRDASPDYRRLTRLLRTEVERLDAIVNRFLDFARTPRLVTTDRDVDATVRDLMPLLLQSAPPTVTIRFEAGDAGTARLDPVALKQALFNLVRNAFEAVSEHGAVTVRTTREDRGVRIEVEDDGPGVPPAERERVFRYGYTTKPTGTGMGLAVAQRLITEMGGAIDLESSAGGGTVAVIRLSTEEPS